MEIWGVEIEIGFLWFDLMRKELTKYQFRHPGLVWFEGKGWLDRTYYVKGDKKTITQLARQFDGYSTRPSLIS